MSSTFLFSLKCSGVEVKRLKVPQIYSIWVNMLSYIPPLGLTLFFLKDTAWGEKLEEEESDQKDETHLKV